MLNGVLVHCRAGVIFIEVAFLQNSTEYFLVLTYVLGIVSTFRILFSVKYQYNTIFSY